MPTNQTGEYVTDSGDGDKLYYAVQGTNGNNFQPNNVVFYTDILCDPTTAVLAGAVVGPMLPASGGGGGGAAGVDTEVAVLTDDSGAVVFVKYEDGVASYFSDPAFATSVVPTLPFKSTVPVVPQLVEAYEDDKGFPVYVKRVGATVSYYNEPTLTTVALAVDLPLRALKSATKPADPSYQLSTIADSSLNGISTSLSIANVGAANGLVGGVILKPGEALSWEAPQGTKLTAIGWDATGTEFAIISVDQF